MCTGGGIDVVTLCDWKPIVKSFVIVSHGDKKNELQIHGLEESPLLKWSSYHIIFALQKASEIPIKNSSNIL